MWPFNGESGGLSCCSVCRTTQAERPANLPIEVLKSNDGKLTGKDLTSSPSKTAGVAPVRAVASANGSSGATNLASPKPAALEAIGLGGPDAALAAGSPALRSTGTDSRAPNSARSARSAVSFTSSVGSELINEKIPAHQREVARIQSQMKAFVKGMVKGREMSVLSVDGQLRACSCSLDRKLRNYVIVINKETRPIPLSKFREVFQGCEPDDIATPLDELCATFVLESGECLSFRFGSVQEREDFAMCLQIIVDGHH